MGSNLTKIKETNKKPGRRLSTSISLTSISALLLAVCFPGMGDLGGLVFLWPLPLFYVLFTLSNKRLLLKGIALGYLCGLIFWLCNLKWFLAMADLDFVPLGGAIFAWLILPSYLAVYFAIFCAFVTKWGNPWREPKPKVHKSRIDEKIAKKQKLKSNNSKLLLSLKEALSSIRFALFHASLWTILEWVRSVLLTGFSWNGLGAAFYNIPVLAQSAELVGVIGLSFAPMFVASIFIQLVFRMVREFREGRMRPHLDLAAAGLLIAAMFGFGISRLYSLSAAETRDVSFLIIQKNIPLDEKHGDASHIANMGHYAQVTLEELEKIEENNKKKFDEFQKSNNSNEVIPLDHVDYIMWPESTILHGVLFNKETNTQYYSPVEQVAIDKVIQAGSHSLITGCNEFHFENEAQIYNDGPSESYNSIAVLGQKPDQTILKDIYKKNHLVIFGEYIPLRETFPVLEDIVGSAHGTSLGPNYLPGENYEPMKLSHDNKELQLIGSVCFEDTVGRVTRKSVRNAEQIIVNVTNDGWFGDSEEPRQHFANALFRTIEIRRPMVRSANTGVSCIINVKGSIENGDGSLNAVVNEEGSFFTAGNLFANAKVLTDPPITLYAMAGDWFIVFCAVIFTLTWFINLKRRTL